MPRISQLSDEMRYAPLRGRLRCFAPITVPCQILANATAWEQS